MKKKQQNSAVFRRMQERLAERDRKFKERGQKSAAARKEKQCVN